MRPRLRQQGTVGEMKEKKKIVRIFSFSEFVNSSHTRETLTDLHMVVESSFHLTYF